METIMQTENVIDNSNLIRDKILKFESPDDFYFVSVMWRRKDHPECPANENARMLASWCIKNVEYFDRKLPLIKDYCEHFQARAYIKPQVRSCKDINRQLLVFLANQVDNMDLAYSTFILVPKNKKLFKDTFAREASLISLYTIKAWPFIFLLFLKFISNTSPYWENK